MKGFIEVHSAARKARLINANGIEYIVPHEYGTWIMTRRGEGYPVTEHYEIVKKLILEALTPTFTVYREKEEQE